MQSVAFAWQVLDQSRGSYRALIEQDRDLDTLGPILRPELFMRARYGASGRNLRSQVELCKAAVAFLEAVDKVRGELAAEETTP